MTVELYAVALVLTGSHVHKRDASILGGIDVFIYFGPLAGASPTMTFYDVLCVYLRTKKPDSQLSDNSMVLFQLLDVKQIN